MMQKFNYKYNQLLSIYKKFARKKCDSRKLGSHYHTISRHTNNSNDITIKKILIVTIIWFMLFLIHAVFSSATLKENFQLAIKTNKINKIFISIYFL